MVCVGGMGAVCVSLPRHYFHATAVDYCLCRRAVLLGGEYVLAVYCDAAGVYYIQFCAGILLAGISLWCTICPAKTMAAIFVCTGSLCGGGSGTGLSVYRL